MKRINWGNWLKLFVGIGAVIDICYVIYMILFQHMSLTIFGCLTTMVSFLIAGKVYEDLIEE